MSRDKKRKQREAKALQGKEKRERERRDRARAQALVLSDGEGETGEIERETSHMRAEMETSELPQLSAATNAGEREEQRGEQEERRLLEGHVKKEDVKEEDVKTETVKKEDEESWEREGESGGSGGPKRRTRRSVNQNLGRTFCWATCSDTGQPCENKVPKGSNIPYCEFHLREGDGALEVVDHPTVGKIVVARVDLEKGYKMVHWGKRCRWRGCKGHDKAMSFRPNGGVIDPSGFKGQQVQYMACPGPSERSNTKVTTVCFGKTYDRNLVGREIETTEPLKKNTQLLQWYGSKDWFAARDVPRRNVGTKEYPAPLRRRKEKKKVAQTSILVPRSCSDLGGRLFEYSLHKCVGVVKEIAYKVFPELCKEKNQEIVAVPTFQCALFDLSSEQATITNEVGVEMNKLHLNFVTFESIVYKELTQLGYFCDSVDPLTGCAMHSSCGIRYSEVVGMQMLLGHEVIKLENVSFSVHPDFRMKSYPVTFFSNAPYEMINEKIQEALFQLQVTNILGLYNTLNTDII